MATRGQTLMSVLVLTAPITPVAGAASPASRGTTLAAHAYGTTAKPSLANGQQNGPDAIHAAVAAERATLEMLLAISKANSRTERQDENLLDIFYCQFGVSSGIPGFFLAGDDKVILPEDYQRAFGQPTAVPVLVMPSLKAIQADIDDGMNYQEALGALALFPSGNIQSIVLEAAHKSANKAVKVALMLSLRRADLKELTTKQLAGYLKGQSTELRLAALLALQPCAIGDDLSGGAGVGFGAVTPISAESLRLRRNAYDVAHVFSCIEGVGFEGQAVPLVLGLLSCPQFASLEASRRIAKELEGFGSLGEENAFIAHCRTAILKQRQ